MAVPISIYNQTLNDAFLKGVGLENPGALPDGSDKWMQKVPSQNRIETYPFMSASPGIQEYMGKRRLANVSPTNFEVLNRTYDAGFQVLLEDIEDDKASGYALTAEGLGKKASQFPVERCMRLIAAGASTPCMDGSNFFADSHNVGSGDNSLTYNGARNDGSTNKIIALITDEVIKPLLWQDRAPAYLENDYDEKRSRFLKKVNYWTELRGASTVGPWWLGVLVTCTDIPYPYEAEEIIGNILAAFRSFAMPKAVDTDETQYFHGAKQFNQNSLTLMVPPNCEHSFRKCLEGGMIATSGGAAQDAIYKGMANLVVNPFL